MRYRTIVADPPWEVGDFPKWGDEDGVTPCPYPTMTLEAIKALPVGSWADTGAHLYLWTINEFLVPSFDVARAWGFEPSAVLVWCKPPRGIGVGGLFSSNVEFLLFCRRKGGPTILAVTSYLADAADRNGISRAEVNRYMGTSDMAGWWLSRLEHRCKVPTPEQYEQIKRLVGAGDDMDEAVRAIYEAEKPPQAHVDTRWFTWPRGKHSEKPEAFLDMVEQVSPGPYLEMFARRDRLGWHTWGNESLETAEVVNA